LVEKMAPIIAKKWFKPFSPLPTQGMTV
jgi:hypothetical protein